MLLTNSNFISLNLEAIQIPLNFAFFNSHLQKQSGAMPPFKKFIIFCICNIFASVIFVFTAVGVRLKSIFKKGGSIFFSVSSVIFCALRKRKKIEKIYLTKNDKKQRREITLRERTKLEIIIKRNLPLQYPSFVYGLRPK